MSSQELAAAAANNIPGRKMQTHRLEAKALGKERTIPSKCLLRGDSTCWRDIQHDRVDDGWVNTTEIIE